MIEAGELSEGHGRAILSARTTATAAPGPRAPATRAGRSARPSARARRARRAPAAAGAAPVVVHPDLAEALAAAEDAMAPGSDAT